MAREDIPLDLLDQTIWWGERKRGRKEKENKEKLHILSRIFGNRTVVSRRSKRQSSSMRRGLRIETKINGFLQTPRDRGFSLTRFILGLSAIQMA